MKDYEKIEGIRRNLTLVLMYLNRIEDNNLPNELKNNLDHFIILGKAMILLI